MTFQELDREPQMLSPEQQDLLEAILLEKGSDWNAFPLSSAQSEEQG